MSTNIDNIIISFGESRGKQSENREIAKLIDEAYLSSQGKPTGLKIGELA